MICKCKSDIWYGCWCREWIYSFRTNLYWIFYLQTLNWNYHIKILVCSLKNICIISMCFFYSVIIIFQINILTKHVYHLILTGILSWYMLFDSYFSCCSCLSIYEDLINILLYPCMNVLYIDKKHLWNKRIPMVATLQIIFMVIIYNISTMF